MAKKTKSTLWYIYILRCADKTLYTGITIDLDKRIDEHNNIKEKGARYTRGRRPVKLIYSEMAKSRSKASIREAQIKKLNRLEKEQLILDNKELRPKPTN